MRIRDVASRKGWVWFALALVAWCVPAWTFAQTAESSEAPVASTPSVTSVNASEGDDGMRFAFDRTALIHQIRDALDRGEYLELFAILWHAELFSVGGGTVKLSQLVIAAIFFVIGLVVARWLARLVESRVSKIKRIPASVPPMFNKLAYWFLIVGVVLITLSIGGIPLTVFAFLGGALAIGIGFGAQNLCNNLISGLIILTERPIRLGDIIEIDGLAGRVEDIGNRCTRVRRFDGIDLLVPNSTFLEQAVINWTLKDSDVRGCVTVGVSYGSDVRLTRQLIDQGVQEHDRIKKTPNPEVLFTEFGDNALGFEVFFWTTVTRPMDLRRIESDLRYRIEELFGENKIIVAFPQRDVHLDTLSPLQVVLSRQPRTQADGA